MDTGKIGAIDIESSRATACGDDQFFVVHCVVVVELDGFGATIDCDDSCIQLQRNTFIGIELFRSQIDSLNTLLAG